MIIKTLLLSTILILSSCYTLDQEVLVLTDDDFPSIISEFSHILIQFYAPWCGHCQRLQPVYKQVAKALKQSGSTVKLAKVDSTQQKIVSQQYQIQGFPTLLFFMNGQQMKYNGPRNKEGMLAWLLKRAKDPLAEITPEQYEKLSSQDSVSIVYHGDIANARNVDALKKLASSDDYNMYYWGKNLGKSQGTIELIRNFDTSKTYQGEFDEKFELWVNRNQRQTVVPFDQRTIGTMFQGSNKKGLVLFNNDNSEVILDAFTQAAKQYQGEIYIFTQIKQDNEHIDNFADFIKVNRKEYPVVLIDSSAQNKFVLQKEPTKENILEFLNNYNDFKYGISQQMAKATQNKEEQATPQTAQETPEQL